MAAPYGFQFSIKNGQKSEPIFLVYIEKLEVAAIFIRSGKSFIFHRFLLLASSQKIYKIGFIFTIILVKLYLKNKLSQAFAPVSSIVWDKMLPKLGRNASKNYGLTGSTINVYDSALYIFCL